MSVMVNVRQAKTQLSRLLKRAHEGEEIVLAHRKFGEISLCKYHAVYANLIVCRVLL